jgi:hypothetical protein
MEAVSLLNASSLFYFALWCECHRAFFCFWTFSRMMAEFLLANNREEPKKVGQIFSTSFTLAKNFAHVFPKSLIFAM